MLTDDCRKTDDTPPVLPSGLRACPVCGGELVPSGEAAECDTCGMRVLVLAGLSSPRSR
jgi:hypothetical protein